MILFYSPNPIPGLFVEVERVNQKAFEKLMKKTATAVIGCVTEGREFKVFGLKGELCIEASLDVLKQAWQRPLRTV